jgi:hypothetical protein
MNQHWALAIDILWHMQTIIETQAKNISEPSNISPESKKPQSHKRIRKSKPAPITRISIEGSALDQANESRPRLKSGVYISKADAKQERPLVVAAAQTAISISHPGARAIVAKFDGLHSASQISEELAAPMDVVEDVISKLLSAQLIDVKNSKIKLHNRFQSPIAERASHTQDQSNDAFFRQLQNRIIFKLCNFDLDDRCFAPLLLLNIAGVVASGGRCVGNFATRQPEEKRLNKRKATGLRL